METLERIGRENFGLQYDPANLFEARQEYGEAAVRRLGPHLRQLSVQSVRLARPDEPDVWEHAGHFYRRCLLDEPGALDYDTVFRGLRAVGFAGYVTLNEPRPPLMETGALVRHMYDRVKAIAASAQLPSIGSPSTFHIPSYWAGLLQLFGHTLIGQL